MIVINGFQAVHMTFTKQIATFSYLLDHLLVTDGLPSVLATSADPFQALGNTVRVFHGIDDSVAATTQCRPTFQAQVFNGG